MKAEIAKRTTTCNYCKDPIPPRSERLTDFIRVTSKKSKNGFVILRKHYHFNKPDQDRSCYELFASETFERIPEEERIVKSSNPKGRPKLDITDDQRIQRSKLLRRLYNQVDYYITKGHLDLSAPHMLTEVSVQDVRRAERFRRNIKSILEELEDCGGIPAKFKRMVETEPDNGKVTPEEKESRLNNLSRSLTG